MRPPRSLPTVIGPTENALRALLVTLVSSTGIGGYADWVVLNAAASADPTQAPGHWHSQVADGLAVGVEEVDAVVERLRAAGTLDALEAPTDAGAAALAAARTRVAAATSRLLDGIDDDDLDTTRRVLDRVRERAQELRVEGASAVANTGHPISVTNGADGSSNGPLR